MTGNLTTPRRVSLHIKVLEVSINNLTLFEKETPCHSERSEKSFEGEGHIERREISLLWRFHHLNDRDSKNMLK